MSLVHVNCRTQRDWLERALAAIAAEGCCLVDDVLTAEFLERLRVGMYRARERILDEVGTAKLEKAGELGVLRLMLKFDSVFYELLEVPEVLAVVDATLSSTAILHLQNGFILPSFAPSAAPQVFQNTFHRDFPRYLNGYVASLNTFFAVDRFTEANGATFVLPGSHQRPGSPSTELLRTAIPVECEAGAMLVFDSTLWHASGRNVSGRDRLAVNQQFTRSWIKQQIDYVRAIGLDSMLTRSARTQQLLGGYTRVVTSLEEYYRPEDQRIYRSGQG